MTAAARRREVERFIGNPFCERQASEGCGGHLQDAAGICMDANCPARPVGRKGIGRVRGDLVPGNPEDDAVLKGDLEKRALSGLGAFGGGGVFDGGDEAGGVVGGGVDGTADGVDFHLVGGEGAEVGEKFFGGRGRGEPGGDGVGGEDGGHAVVDGGEEGIGGRGDDGAGGEDFAGGVGPGFPEAGEGEGAAGFKAGVDGGFGAVGVGARFVEAVGGDEAAAAGGLGGRRVFGRGFRRRALMSGLAKEASWAQEGMRPQAMSWSSGAAAGWMATRMFWVGAMLKRARERSWRRSSRMVTLGMAWMIFSPWERV